MYIKRSDALVLLLCKASQGIAVAIGEGQIGLDVEDGSPVHQVGSINLDDRSLACVEMDGKDTYTGQTDVIGTERTARGPYTHALIPSQTGRSNCGSPRLPIMSFTEIPQKPDVAETFQSTQGIGIAILGSKDDAGRQTVDQTALPGNPKLGGEVGVYVCNDFHD